MKKLIISFLVLIIGHFVNAQQTSTDYIQQLTPLQIATFVADREMDQTKFGYEYTLQPLYPDIETIDFGKSLDNRIPGIGYAITTMISEIEQTHEFEVGRTGALKIWINDNLVFSRDDYPSFKVVFDETTYVLSEKFTVNLKAGENKVFIKSDYIGSGDWLILLQGRNMGRFAEKGKRIQCSLIKYAPNIQDANWLVLGTFEGSINTVCEPENNLEFYRLYSSGGRTFTWNIPRINLLVRNKTGGSYNWIYHVGCFMWSLQRLSQETDNPKYINYADEWCNFVLSSKSLVKYQTHTLNAIRSMNFGLVNRPMLDYTSAPSMPFLTRLSYTDDFPNKEIFKTQANNILQYLMQNQFRYDGIFARTYTIEPTIWADDMFMGLPYIVYSAQILADTTLHDTLLDDAAEQVITFSRYLQDPKNGLYRQACYPNKPELKVPFWSRGNGWALWATSEVLQALPEKHPLRNQILNQFRKQIDGLLLYQNPDGSWNNVLGLEGSKRESSGTAMFTLCLARGINKGWLNRESYATATEKAYKAMCSFVDNNGDFNGVKGGTNFSTDPMDYERTELRKSDTHGLLPLIFACLEMEYYFKDNK